MINLVKYFAVLTLFTVVPFSFYHVITFRHYYGEAETVADELQIISRKIPLNEMTQGNIKSLLNKEKNLTLHNYDTKFTREGKVLLVINVNKRYSVGVDRDGSIIWNPDRNKKKSLLLEFFK